MQLEINNIIEQSVLDKFKILLIFLNIFFSIIQIFISSNVVEIIFILILVNMGSYIAYQIALSRDNLTYFLLPCLIILMTNFFYLVFPLIFTALLGQAININLELPNQSFLFSFINLVTIIIAMNVLIKFNPINKINDKNKILSKYNIFTLPDYKSVLSMFFIIFIIKSYLVIFDGGLNDTTESGDMVSKFFYGFYKFISLPIFMFFYFYFYTKKISKVKFNTFIMINVFLGILYAILTNSRTEIFRIILVIIFAYFLIFLSKKIYLSGRRIFSILVFVIISSLLIEGLSKKILEGRSLRDNVTPLDLLKFSTDSTGPDEKIFLITELSKDYEYTNNVLINRFMPIKYLDKMLYDSGNFSRVDVSEFRTFFYFKSISFIPQTFINIIYPEYRKDTFFIGSGTYTERVAYQIDKGPFNKGSFISEIYLATNSYFLCFFIIFLLYLLLFIVILKFQYHDVKNIYFSPLILMMIFELLYVSQADSTLDFLTLIIRIPLELILLYNLLKFITFNYKTSKDEPKKNL